MGNTLCKPAIQVTQQTAEQPKIVESLLTEEAIKILNLENEVKVEPVISETKETEAIKEIEPVISETKEPVETVVEPVETVLEPVISETKEPEVETLSIVQPPDEASSTSSKEDEVPPLKKKRGRKKKGEQ